MKDRTGELCPICKKGKLYPAGEREVLEPAKAPRSGESHRETTEYECDACHQKPKAQGISLTETISESASVSVKKTNKKKSLSKGKETE